MPLSSTATEVPDLEAAASVCSTKRAQGGHFFVERPLQSLHIFLQQGYIALQLHHLLVRSEAAWLEASRDARIAGLINFIRISLIVKAGSTTEPFRPHFYY